MEHDQVPETKAIRGDLDSLFWLKKVSETETTVIHFIHIYLKGKLPGIAKTMIPGGHYDGFMKLKKAVEV